MTSDEKEQAEPILLIHGGTGMQLAEDEAEKQACLDSVAAAVQSKLRAGTSAVDAVDSAVRLLEESGLYLAGTGSTPQRDGVIRRDASIMCSTGRAGAVLAVSTPNSTMAAARAVMDRIGHTSIVGEAADACLSHLGVETTPALAPTTSIKQCVDDHLAAGGSVFGTVGAIAVDLDGKLAAATSTGGFPTALPGRSGDSGAIGIGTYATDRCAISCTGDGDRFLLAGVGTRLDAYLDAGLSPAEAVAKTLGALDKLSANGGFIAAFPSGELIVGKNVPVLRFGAGGGRPVTIESN